MKVEVNVTKGKFFVLLAAILVLAGAFLVYAYNSNPANPAVFGHSGSEISGVCLVNGTGCPSVDMKIVESINSSTQGHPTALAFCPSGYKVSGCSGARNRDLLDKCDESNCGFVGSIPVNAQGNRSTNPVGCKASTDGAEVIVHAYCVRLH